MNSITLVGRLTADPEIRVAKNKDKTTIANFNIAVYRDKETTDFIRCIAFSNTAELIEKYFVKGLRVAVNGSLNIDIVENKDGAKEYYTKVVVRNIEICQSKNESQSNGDDFVEPGDEKPPWEDNGGAKKASNKRR
nr:MAG TPA: Single strand binding protein [Bacteriophage sp.]